MTAVDISWLDADTVQLRQTKSSHWEAPFLFLLFGHDRALLIDTGATSDETVFPLRATVEQLIAIWLRRHPAVFARPYPLVVAHSHAHGDHIAGDALLADRPGTTVVGTTPAEVIAFFDFQRWPDETVALELGRRPVEVIAGPGHEPSAVVFFDRATGVLFTGDTVLPGHLYVRDAGQYRATIERLVRFRDAAPGPVREVRGAHVEMSADPGHVYPPGTVDQPDELPLPLPPDILDQVLDALGELSGEPGVRVERVERVVRERFVIVAE